MPTLESWCLGGENGLVFRVLKWVLALNHEGFRTSFTTKTPRHQENRKKETMVNSQK
jgi:hypothetical protein